MRISITFGEHGRTEDYDIEPEVPDSVVFNRESIKARFVGFEKFDGKWQRLVAEFESPGVSVNIHGHRYQFTSPVDSDGFFTLAAAG